MSSPNLAQSAGHNGLGLVLAALVLVGVLLLVVLFVAALVSILRSPHLTGTGKLLWVVIVLFLQFFGPLAWFLFGRTTPLDATSRR